MINKLISHYRILEKIGHGGMGEVYKAEDTKLKRLVALKFLPPELTRDPEAKKRFIHEARAASSLEHSNICTIHEIDETEDGQMFICMAYYEGETLKKKIEAGPQKIETTVEFAIQIVRGMSSAHEASMIHRDIKPANIMITSQGEVKIVDFGLAKLTGQTKLTTEGTTLGTTAYMSPEQAQGAEVDYRTDIWSLGVVLYEMLTGQSPFKGDYEQAVVYSILNENPEPITALRTGVPIELEQIVFKALAKNPNERYQHTDELLTDLQKVHKTLTRKTDRFVPALSKPQRRSWLVSPVLWTLIVILFGLAGGVLFFYPSKTIPFSARDWILIADFENLTKEEVFDRSLNTALTVSIQQSNYVNIFPRSRVKETLQRMQLEKEDTLGEALAREVAVREGIKVLVVPIINRIGEVYLLSTRIIEPNSQVTLITKTAQAKGKDEVLYALDELAEKIRADLGESLASINNKRVPLPKATTSSLEALKSFSEGSRAWESGNYNEAEALWHTAIEKDSNFAWARTSLGGYYYWANNRPDGEVHFTKALSLLDRLTEREKLWIRSMINGWRGDHEASIKDLNIFLSQYPDDRDAWHNLGNGNRWLKRYDVALKAYKKALDIDPYMASAYINIATCYNITEKYSEAIPHYLKAFELQPKWITSGNLNHEFGFAYVEVGEFNKAEEIFGKMLSEADWQKARGHRSFALLDMYRGKYSAAIDNLKEAILFNKAANSTLSEIRDRLYLANSYRTKALMAAMHEQLNVVNKLRKATPLEPWWLLLLGKMYARIGNTQQANLLLKEISTNMNEVNRNDKAAYNVLKGEIELTRGNHEKAIDLFEIAYKLREDNFMLESLAYGYLVHRDLEKALDKYMLLVSRKNLGWEAQDYWIHAHYQLGKIYEETGKIDKSMQYYETLIDIWQEADNDLPVLLDAAARLAKLKRMTRK